MLLPFCRIAKNKEGPSPLFHSIDADYFVTSTQRLVVARSSSSIVNRTALL